MTGSEVDVTVLNKDQLSGESATRTVGVLEATLCHGHADEHVIVRACGEDNKHPGHLHK